MKVIASIVTFNADMERLKQNIEAILPQVEEIVVVDNGSKNLHDVEKLIKGYINIHLITECKNLGIAKALNDAFKYAESKSYDWVFTLDQDSVTVSDCVATLLHSANNNTGIICAHAVDRNFHSNDERKMDKGVRDVDACITSGSLTSIKAWKDCGGFDEQMFIDWVDWDICYAMRVKGYRILKSYYTNIIHELGTDTKSFHIFGHEYLILNRSPFRYYYVFRNRIYLARKYSFLSMTKQKYYNFRDFLIAMIFESHKLSNLRAMYKGQCDGYKMEIANG